MDGFNIGDFVWFIKTFDEINWYPCRFRPTKTTKPFQMKIINIDKTKNGLMFQTRRGHFSESMIGKIVFKNEEDAYKIMEQ